MLGRQLRRGEGKRGGQRVGVEAPALPESVDPDRQGGGPALERAPGSGLGVEQHRGAECAHPSALGLERALARRVHGEVEPDSEQLLLPSRQAGGKVARVGGGHLDLGIGQAALGRVGPAPRFEAGELATQAVGCDLGRQRLDVHGHVEAARMRGERLEPPEAHLAGVAHDGEARAPAVPDPERPGQDLDAVGPEGRRWPRRVAAEPGDGPSRRNLLHPPTTDERSSPAGHWLPGKPHAVLTPDRVPATSTGLRRHRRERQE